MRVTPDRLAVARAVRDEMRNPVFYNGSPRPQAIEKIIEAIPEPEPQPAPDVQARRRKECGFCGRDESQGTGPLAPADEPPLSNALICRECASNRCIHEDAPDVQAQIDAARAEEREACAKIVAREAEHRERISLSSVLLRGIEQEIRARSGSGR